MPNSGDLQSLQRFTGDSDENGPSRASRALFDRIDYDRICEEVHRARKRDFTPYDFQRAEAAIEHFQHKHGKTVPIKSPDTVIIVRFLAVAPWPKLEQLLDQLEADRPAERYVKGYSWYPPTALDRIRGVPADYYARWLSKQKLMRTHHSESAAIVASAAARIGRMS